MRARIRGAEHLKELEGGNLKNVLYQHKVKEHMNQNVNFQMIITSKFKDALTCQANESVQIYSRPRSETLIESNSSEQEIDISKVLCKFLRTSLLYCSQMLLSPHNTTNNMLFGPLSSLFIRSKMN